MTLTTITTAAKKAAIPAAIAALFLLSTAALSGMEEPSMPTPDLTTAHAAVPTAEEAAAARVIHPQVLPFGPMTRLFTGEYADREGAVYVLKAYRIRRPDGVLEIREAFVPTGDRLPF